MARSDDPAIRDDGFSLDLRHFESFTTVEPTTIGVTVKPESDGSLELSPNLGPGIDHEDLDRRWHQLHDLGQVCLHPGLVHEDLLDGAQVLSLSARTATAISPILDTVRTAREKAIVFVRTKAMQRALATWLRDRYGVPVDVVNGDTPATGSTDSRVKRIRRFEAREGFGVIIMSPLAAGVGLTVVGANHAIHLERHWNPAKEAQATDRVYRIGQTRPVHVYYPMALHPDVDSFGVNLDRLLRSKVALSGAVVVPERVTEEEIAHGLGLRA
ncbi:C-terminal helicase domain-containing protein [Isoptericola halotolerans]|uniref:helicase-related protein n=1 Tax=Isoptericola halotolerans TaxID=300560 RepID=UPI00388D35B3